MTNPSAAPHDHSLQEIQTHLCVALLCDALDQIGLHRNAIDAPLRALTVSGRLVGRARTSLWADMAHKDPAPYALEFEAVDGCQQGDVLIAAAAGSMRSGIWGELLSTAARNRGCVGAIIDGAARDIDLMTDMGFAVYAKGTSPYDSLNRQRCIDVNVPVDIGGVIFNPGDLVMADTDGLVVVPQAVENDVIRRAWEKVNAESLTRQELKAGAKASEVYAKYGVL